MWSFITNTSTSSKVLHLTAFSNLPSEIYVEKGLLNCNVLFSFYLSSSFRLPFQHGHSTLVLTHGASLQHQKTWNIHIYLSKKLTMLGFFNSFITRISLMINSFFGCFCKLICLIATYEGKRNKKNQNKCLILLENYKHQSGNNLIYYVSIIWAYSQVTFTSTLAMHNAL